MAARPHRTSAVDAPAAEGERWLMSTMRVWKAWGGRVRKRELGWGRKGEGRKAYAETDLQGEADDELEGKGECEVLVLSVSCSCATFS